MLFFVIDTPYTWIGGGGSVGNRYFMGAYGVFLFLLPPIDADVGRGVPWLVGGAVHRAAGPESVRDVVPPGRRYAKHGPLRWLPVELTLVNDCRSTPKDRAQVRVWFGDNPGQNDPGFQIYFLDDNAYGRESGQELLGQGGVPGRVPDQVRDRPTRRQRRAARHSSSSC